MNTMFRAVDHDGRQPGSSTSGDSDLIGELPKQLDSRLSGRPSDWMFGDLSRVLATLGSSRTWAISVAALWQRVLATSAGWEFNRHLGETALHSLISQVEAGHVEIVQAEMAISPFLEPVDEFMMGSLKLFTDINEISELVITLIDEP